METLARVPTALASRTRMPVHSPRVSARTLTSRAVVSSAAMAESARTYCASVAAASLAEFVTYPLDLTKTRLQIQGEVAKKTGNVAPYRGMLGTGIGIVREEGLLRLWQGIPPALARHVIYSGTRILLYEKLRNNVFGGNKQDIFPLWKSALCGVTSGMISQWLASPTDLVKVQVQMEGRQRLLGEPPRINGAWDAFKKVLHTGGIRGLWKGSVPNMQRAALVNLGDLTTYDMAKQHIMAHTGLPDKWPVHALASSAAGLVAAGLGTPADVVKTRVMNQPTGVDGKGLYYKSSIDCLRKTIRGEGFMALYKGFLPVWIRMAPWSLTFWLSFEKIRYIGGVEIS